MYIIYLWCINCDITAFKIGTDRHVATADDVTSFSILLLPSLIPLFALTDLIIYITFASDRAHGHI